MIHAILSNVQIQVFTPQKQTFLPMQPVCMSDCAFLPASSTPSCGGNKARRNAAKHSSFLVPQCICFRVIYIKLAHTKTVNDMWWKKTAFGFFSLLNGLTCVIDGKTPILTYHSAHTLIYWQGYKRDAFWDSWIMVVVDLLSNKRASPAIWLG